MSGKKLVFGAWVDSLITPGLREKQGSPGQACNRNQGYWCKGTNTGCPDL